MNEDAATVTLAKIAKRKEMAHSPSWTLQPLPTSMSLIKILLWIVAITSPLHSSSSSSRAHALSSTSSSSSSSPTTSLGTLSISPLCFGTLNLSSSVKKDKLSEKEEEKDDVTITQSILQSLPCNTLIDTAERYGYGSSNLQGWGTRESTLGQALDNLKNHEKDERKRLYIATKFAPSPRRTTPSSVLDACQDSLSRLSTSKIDLYQLHYPDKPNFFGRTNDEVYWEGIVQCYQCGLISNVGVCNYGPTMIQRAHTYFTKQNNIPLVSNQINFNLMRYRSSLETKLICDDLGIQVMGYHPLANGILTNKYVLGEEETLERISQYSRHRTRYFLKGTVGLRERVEIIGKERGWSCAQVAIEGVRGKGVVPIVGAKSVEQVKENWSVVINDDNRLTEEEMKMLDDASNDSVEYYKGFDLV